MPILVAYSSKYGSTQGIAERITARLRALGRDARMLPAAAVDNPLSYSAFVIGGATYRGAWRADATDFVRANAGLLATRPVWLFCSGPLGTDVVDADGRDLLDASEPREFSEFDQLIKPRAMHVFFGTMDPGKLNLGDRLVRQLPPVRVTLPEGDFRDWTSIDTWADGIASELAPRASTRS